MSDQDRKDLVVSSGAAAGITQPLRAPVGVPKRAIDDYDWQDGRTAPLKVHVEEGAAIRYEYEPCPGWMREATYQALIDRLTMGMRETPAKPLTKLMAWTARHIWVVRSPRKLVSDSSLGDNAGTDDLVGIALDMAREAKARGIDLAELGKPTRRRLLE